MLHLLHKLNNDNFFIVRSHIILNYNFKYRNHIILKKPYFFLLKISPFYNTSELSF